MYNVFGGVGVGGGWVGVEHVGRRSGTGGVMEGEHVREGVGSARKPPIADRGKCVWPHLLRGAPQVRVDTLLERVGCPGLPILNDNLSIERVV